MMMSESTRARASLFTVESALYVVLFALGFFARVLALDGVPLSGAEARHALAAWNWLRGLPDALTSSPLLFSADVLVFALFGASDWTARIIPALVGSGMIILPGLIRTQLGRTAALIASALLAFSPALVFFSRQADGAILASTWALAALVFAWRYLNNRAARDANGATVCAALALLSAPEVWTIVFAFVLFALAAHAGWVAHLSTNETRHDRRVVQQAAILFGLTLVGVATFFLMHRTGLGAAFALFGVWLDGWMPGGSVFDPFRALVVYEPIVLFFGVAALVDLAFTWREQMRARPLLGVFVIWSLVALLLHSLSGDKSPARVVVIVVPLTLLASWYIGAWCERLCEAIQASPMAYELLLTQEAPVLFLASAVTGFLGLLIVEFTLRGGLVAADTLAILLGRGAGTGMGGTLVALVVLVGFVSIAFVTLATVGFERAKNVGMFFLLIMLALWTLRQAALVNFVGAPHGTAHYFGLNPQDLYVAQATSPSVRDLARDVEDASRWRANHVHSLVFAIDASLSPVVAWELRQFPYATITSNPTTQNNQALILPGNAPAPAPNWISQSYRVELVRVPQANLLRWLLFRDVGAVEAERVVLWLPSP